MLSYNRPMTHEVRFTENDTHEVVLTVAMVSRNTRNVSRHYKYAYLMRYNSLRHNLVKRRFVCDISLGNVIKP